MFALSHPPTPTLPRKEGGRLLWHSPSLFFTEWRKQKNFKSDGKTPSTTGIDVREIIFNGSTHSSPPSLRGRVRVGGSQPCRHSKPDNFATTSPRQSRNYGATLAISKSTALSSAAKSKWDDTLSISIVRQPVSLLNWMAANMRTASSMIINERRGLIRVATGLFDFGTMKSMRILKTSWSKFISNFIDLLINPPPQPSPARREGVIAEIAVLPVKKWKVFHA